MAVVDWINMFALAVNEENAAGGRVVTAPTNGACGIVPAVLAYYDKFIRKVNANSLARYLLVTSAIGSLYKMNALDFRRRSGLPGRSRRRLFNGGGRLNRTAGR
ncbi:L-serine dehydratase 1 [Raoultella terrigena]|uniref:L-serine ammonia-lyase n=1 Tax=Raoultella terrigena TaxID=577 RepID=A0A7Z8Z6U4_RAOTE|nr:L-serine dehydratase 1 [Raoultella terrigena]